LPGASETLLQSALQLLQDCFVQRDVKQLERVVLSMEPLEAEEHMARCIKADLWVPGGSQMPSMHRG